MTAAASNPPQPLRSLARRVAARLCLITGLVLVTYVLPHLLQLSLGLHSIAMMEQARNLIQPWWRTPLGAVLLYGALGTHALSALFLVLTRRSAAMRPADALQIACALLIVPALASHVVGLGPLASFGPEAPPAQIGTRLPGSYPVILHKYWVEHPEVGVIQVLGLLAVWIHAGIGLSARLRLAAAWPRFAWAFWLVAVAVPVAALAGFAQAGAELRATLQERIFLIEAILEIRAPSLPLLTEWVLIVERLGLGLALLVGLWLARLGWRARNAARSIHLTYTTGWTYAAAPGISLLEAARLAEIPHASACSARGRCGTCRVRVETGADLLSPPTGMELAWRRALRMGPEMRLACQAVLQQPGQLVVTPLVPPAEEEEVARGIAAATPAQPPAEEAASPAAGPLPAGLGAAA